jgi:two-component system, chemotaxis family, chemotaxis protein CheY
MGQKIMTLEDSAFERKAIINMLNRAGYKDVIEAVDGETGIALYKKEKPDLVLLDLRLPGMQGMDVFKELKKINRSVKVIVVSIVRKQESIDSAKKVGILGYITKPITSAKLLPQVEAAIGKGK